MKKLLSLLTVFTLLFAITACGTTDSTDKKEGTTFAVTHELGTDEVPYSPKKVAVYDMGIADIMEALNVDVELMVPTASVPDPLANFTKNAVNGGTLHEPDLEALFNFEPDLIIISGRARDAYSGLTDIAPTIFMTIDSSKYMEDFTANVELIAQIFGKEAEAKTHLDTINGLVTDIQEIAKTSGEKALIILTNDGNLSAFGPGSRFGMIHDALEIEAADPTIESSTHGQSANFEYIADVNPDILFVVDRGAVVSTVEATSNDFLDNALVNQTTAASNGKITYLNAEDWYIISGGISSVTRMIAEIKAAL